MAARSRAVAAWKREALEEEKWSGATKEREEEESNGETGSTAPAVTSTDASMRLIDDTITLHVVTDQAPTGMQRTWRMPVGAWTWPLRYDVTT